MGCGRGEVAELWKEMVLAQLRGLFPGLASSAMSRFQGLGLLVPRMGALP